MSAAYSATLSHLWQRIGRQALTIREVRVTPISYIPVDGSFVHECGPVVLTKMDMTVIELITDQGLVGIGPGSLQDMGQHTHLLGQNPFDLVRQGVSGGVDVACWDLIGKAKGEPVYRLLAVNHTPSPIVPVYASGGVMWTYYERGDGRPYGVDALIEEALTYKGMGFDTFKWRPGTDWEEAGITPERLGEICRQLREAVGPDFRLGLEKKGYDSWTFDECMAIAPIINELGFFFFEQPMGDEGPAQFADYLAIKERMPQVMLWGGERFTGLHTAQPWIEQRIYDAVQSDCIHLGMTENWQVAQLAAAHNVRIVPHNWTSSLGTMCNTHLVAGTSSGFMCEFFMYDNGFREGLLTEPYRPVNGRITLSDRPGFGVELVPDLARRFPYIPGPNTLANPRFPHAWERAKAREQAVRQRLILSS
jgi:L-alanine-DL-glutamate epimerase-like enolase superfamily enzyme